MNKTEGKSNRCNEYGRNLAKTKIEVVNEMKYNMVAAQCSKILSHFFSSHQVRHVDIPRFSSRYLSFFISTVQLPIYDIQLLQSEFRAGISEFRVGAHMTIFREKLCSSMISKFGNSKFDDL